MAEKGQQEKKIIIVAGGAGFIGSHLCDELVKHHRVICIDNFLTGREENIHQLLSNPDFKFIRRDITEPINLDDFPELKQFRIPIRGIAEIYNLACPTSPKDYEQYTVETLLANALGTKHTLDLAVQYNAKYLLLSSSAIYGEPKATEAFTEDYWGFVDPIGNRSSYVEGKRFAESLVVHYRIRHQIDAKVMRVFNTYGPRMKLTDGRMIPDFIGAALDNKEIVVYGDKESLSTAMYISDLVEATLKMMSVDEAGPVNVGNPETMPKVDVAKLIAELSGSTSTISFRPQAAGTVRQSIPDITRAKETLGWFPVVPLADGLKRTIAYMQGSKTMGIESLNINGKG